LSSSENFAAFNVTYSCNAIKLWDQHVENNILVINNSEKSILQKFKRCILLFIKFLFNEINRSISYISSSYISSYVISLFLHALHICLRILIYFFMYRSFFFIGHCKSIYRAMLGSPRYVTPVHTHQSECIGRQKVPETLRSHRPRIAYRNRKIALFGSTQLQFRL